MHMRSVRTHAGDFCPSQVCAIKVKACDLDFCPPQVYAISKQTCDLDFCPPQVYYLVPYKCTLPNKLTPCLIYLKIHIPIPN